MLSIEEIKLLIEKLEKLKGQDFQKLIDDNLKILKEIETAVDANNNEQINRLEKTQDWFRMDLDQKKAKPVVEEWLRRAIQTKILQFGRTNQYHSLEIGPGNGMFSKDFRAWGKNYFVDVVGEVEAKNIRNQFPSAHQKYLKFYMTDKAGCPDVPTGSCNFVFSWDTFVFFSQEFIHKYFTDIHRVLIPGGYGMIQYADCHYDEDLKLAQKGYWNYNTKNNMSKIILDQKFEIVEMNQFRPGANYVVFRKPGKQNPVVYGISNLTLD